MTTSFHASKPLPLFKIFLFNNLKKKVSTVSNARAQTKSREKIGVNALQKMAPHTLGRVFVHLFSSGCQNWIFFSLRISLCTAEHTYFISCLSCHNRNFHGPIGGWGRVLCYCFLSHFMESKHGNFSLNQLFHFL